MLRLRYSKNSPESGDCASIEGMFDAAHEALLRAERDEDVAIMLQIEPGDSLTYEVCLVVPKMGYNPAEPEADLAVVTMLTPSWYAGEVDLKGPSPSSGYGDLWRLNRHPRTILVDAMVGVLWGKSEREYDYDNSRPKLQGLS